MFEEQGEKLFLAFIALVIWYLFVRECLDFLKFRSIKFRFPSKQPQNGKVAVDGSTTLEAVARPAEPANDVLPIPLPPEPPKIKTRLSLD